MSAPDTVTEDLKQLVAKHGLGKIAGVADWILPAHLTHSLSSIIETLVLKRLHESETQQDQSGKVDP